MDGLPEPTALPLRCGLCRAGTLRASRGEGGMLRCDACPTAVSTDGGMVELVPDFAARRTLGQALMEWPPVVAIYESRFWRRSPGAAWLLGISFDREAECVLAALEPRGTMRVLDLACGSGLYSRAIAQRIPDGHVVALDLSPPMLAYAIAKARRERLANVTWVHGDAMHLPLADASVDAVNCCGALHLFPDPTRALAEIQRVLAPDGRFVAAVARKPDGQGAGAGLSARLAARSGIASWTEAEFQRRLGEAGFAHLACHHAGRAWMIWSARKASLQSPATPADGR